MKTILTRTKWILFLAPVLVAVLLIFGYGAIAKAWQANNAASVSTSGQIADRASTRENEHDHNPEYARMRREFRERFYGIKGVPANAYATARDAVRALPRSSAGQGRTFMSPDSPTPVWTFPVPPPLGNDWGGGGSVRIDAIAVDPTKDDTVYVGSEGGLAKSTDGGTTWTYLSDGLPSQSIRSITIDPIAPNILYAGTGTNGYLGVGIYRSDDGGETWTVSGGTEFAGSGVGKIAIDPTTGGSTSSTTLYASVTREHHRLWKSTDGGSTWTQKRSVTAPDFGPFTFYDIVVDPDDASTLYITAPDGVFISRDSGDTWELIHGIPTPHAPSCLALVRDEHGRNTLFLAFSEPVTHGSNALHTIIVKSSNQGSTWSHPLPPSNAALWCFGVDPAHPNRLFVGGGGDLRYSLDGGNLWLTSESSGNVHVDIHSIAFCPTNTKRHYLGTDGGIYRADYEGTEPEPISWDNKNDNLTGVLMQGISLSSDGHMVMGNQDNGTQHYAGGNTPWTMIFGGDGFQPKIDRDNSNKYYYVGLSYGHLVDNTWWPLTRVVNGFRTHIRPPGAFGENSSGFPAFFMVPGDSARLLLGFQHVWRSVDSGDTWTRIGGTPCPSPLPTPLPANCGIDPTGGPIGRLYEAPSDPNYIYAIAGGHEKIFVTSNANAGNPPGSDATWSDRTPPSEVARPFSTLIVHPENPLTAYLAVSPNIYKTIDMGASWTRQNAIPNAIYHDLEIDPAFPYRIFASSNLGVQVSVNGGLTWEDMSAGIPEGLSISSLSFNASSRQLAAASYGRGVYVIDVPLTAVGLTTPVSGTLVRGIVTVSAVASSDIIGVQFMVDNAFLGREILSPPYSITWNTSLYSGGSHTLTAVAHDESWNATTSLPATVTVDNVAPTISITAPQNGQVVSGTVTISATATDNVGVVEVEFMVDGDPLSGRRTDSPPYYSIPWNTTLEAGGSHTLTAVAHDEAGNMTTSANVTVTVDN